MLNPIFLEIVNGSIAIGAAILLLVLARYMFHGEATTRGKRVARAIFVFMLGTFIFRSWIWLWRHQLNDGHSVDWMGTIPIPFVGYCITVIGIWCMIRVFTLSRQPSWVWAGIIAITVGSLTLLAVL